jgi:hypothetical protein
MHILKMSGESISGQPETAKARQESKTCWKRGGRTSINSAKKSATQNQRLNPTFYSFYWCTFTALFDIFLRRH